MSSEPEDKVSVIRDHLERAMVVRYNVSKGYQHHDMAEEEALRPLNALLADGWRVKHAASLSGTESGVVACALVILEKSLGDGPLGLEEPGAK